MGMTSPPIPPLEEDATAEDWLESIEELTQELDRQQQYFRMAAFIPVVIIILATIMVLI